MSETLSRSARKFLREALILTSVLAITAAGGCTDEGHGGDPADVTPGADTTLPDGTGPDAADVGGDTGPSVDTTPEIETLQLHAVSPSSGLSIGLEQVELIGTGFRSGQQVYFGESLAQDIFVLNSRRMVLLTPPRPPGLADVRVVDPDTEEIAALDKGFLYFNPISVVSVTEERGNLLGGERVVIRGEGFRPESQVLFGVRAALSVEVIDDTTIRALTPAARQPGPVNVHVSNDLGFGTLRQGFRYVGAPEVEAVVPPVGPIAGGTVVEIRGAGFEPPLTVRIGEVQLQQVEVISPSRIRGVTAAVPTEGLRDVVVTTSEGTGALTGGFAYLANLDSGASLELIGVSPGTGSAAGREQVTLIARGLGAFDGTSVRFGARSATVRAVDPAQLMVVVETPAGSGVVDVTLQSAGQSSTLAGAYRYNDDVRIDSVSPGHGPIAGGTPITVTGRGFQAGLELRIGALVAASVRVVDDRTLEAVTPPGAPGLVDAIVIQQGRVHRLNDAFNYDGSYDLILVDPPRGSQAGGSVVTLVGSGFPADARVRFGNRFATHVEVRSSTIITCKSPPGDLGTVPVSVLSDTEGERTLVDAFTYFDPTTNFGGTWGGPVEGDVNVTVIDGSTGEPIPDAFVMLWTDPRTPYQGFTDDRGQVTFSGADLMGEQMVSASKEGYTRASVVEYDATNVTVYLLPTTPPSPGDPPPPPPPATYRGVVQNLGKAVPVPIGRCSDYPNAPGTLCDPCESSSTCGTGGHCTTFPQLSVDAPAERYCTRSCQNTAQCPAGFNCLPVNGVETMQCMPSAGNVTAFCDVTNGGPAPFSRDRIPDPGIQVNPDMSFELPAPFGEFAVFCLGGVLNPATGVFTPLALGVDRRRFAGPGDRLTGQVDLRHPLNRRYSFSLDNVPRGPDGPDIDALWASINLGSDGYITFEPVIDFGVTSFELPNFLGTPSGDLAGATFTFVGGSFSFFTDSQTLTFHQGLPRLDNDLMFFARDGEWEPRRSGISKNVYGLWRTAGNVVGVGSEGLIVRTAGNSWAQQQSGTSRNLRAVHGAGDGGAGRLVAVGDGGIILRWDGLQWRSESSTVTNDLLDVWVASADVAFAVGNNAVLRYAAGAWARETGVPARRMNGVWGFGPDDVWAVGNGGTILRYDGSTWSTLASGTSLAIRSVWGTSPNDVWMVGEGGLVLRWNGLEIVRTQLGINSTLSGVWGTAPDRVYAVGSRGRAYEYNGTEWKPIELGVAARDLDLLAIGGTEDDLVLTGQNELVLGPIIPIPEQLRPGEASIMGNDYRLSWRSQPGTLPHFHYVEIAIPTMFGPEPEWVIMADFDVDTILLPDFPSIEGTPGITSGAKIFTVMRVFREGFDINNHSNADMSLWGWRSWSVQSVNFTKL